MALRPGAVDKRERIKRRIITRVSEESASIHEDYEQRRRERQAEFSSRGLGASGITWDARVDLYEDELEVGARRLVDIAIESHRSERLTWTPKEREWLLEWLARSVQQFAASVGQKLEG